MLTYAFTHLPCLHHHLVSPLFRALQINPPPPPLLTAPLYSSPVFFISFSLSPLSPPSPPLYNLHFFFGGGGRQKPQNLTVLLRGRLDKSWKTAYNVTSQLYALQHDTGSIINRARWKLLKNSSAIASSVVVSLWWGHL